MHLKEKTITSTVLDFLSEHGDRVRYIDLGGCDSPLHYIQEAVIKCPNATELNLVGSTRSEQCVLVFRVLEHLTKLETLKFTVDGFNSIADSKYGNNRFTNIRKLYLEISPFHLHLSIVIRIMSNCDSLEECHVNIQGFSDFPPEMDNKLISLEAKRWDTLHTFVCTSYFSEAQRATLKLLECVFAEKALHKISKWWKPEKMCYIYERGFFNGMLPRSKIAGEEKPDTIFRCLEVGLTGKESTFENLFETPWGKPSSLRVFCPSQLLYPNQLDLNRCLSTALVELDLCDAHILYNKFLDTNFVQYTPSLEALAIPLCFLQSQLTKLLSGLRRLKRLFVQGAKDNNENEFTENRGCRCHDFLLTASTMPSMKALPNLEELTLENIKTTGGIFENLEHPRVHTMRLIFKQGSVMNGLRSALKRCPKLERLMLRTNARPILQYFTEGPNLKMLCVGSQSSRLRLDQCDLERLLKKTDLLHLHMPLAVHSYRSYKYPGLEMYESRGQLVLTWQNKPRIADTRLPGRYLCCREPLIGVVKPCGW